MSTSETPKMTKLNILIILKSKPSTISEIAHQFNPNSDIDLFMWVECFDIMQNFKQNKIVNITYRKNLNLEYSLTFKGHILSNQQLPNEY